MCAIIIVVVILMIADVLVEIKAKNIDKTFTYRIPDDLIEKVVVGVRVNVLFGSKSIEGFVLNVEKRNVDFELKDILSVVDEKPILNEEMLEIGKFLARKTLCSLITCYQSMLPAALKAHKDFVVKKKFDVYVKLGKNVSNLTLKQNELVEYVRKNGEILKSSCNNISQSITKSLISKGVLVEFKREVYRINNDFKIENCSIALNEEQNAVVSTVLEESDKFSPYLLFGVTGSGKTEVYMHIIEKVVEKGKEAIVLVPEISLTPQMVNVFGRRFGSKVAILHSRLNDGEKYDEWRKIERGEVSIVIGARSAIFAPFTNLGVIIIDEEHSDTYKQENNPKYSAIDVALNRAKRYNCPLILGSATPSVESYTRAKIGVYKLLTMKRRVNNTLPVVYRVDMKDEIKNGNSIISRLLDSKIKDRLTKNEQVIILLNRRGYSTTLSCQACGNVEMCPHCDISLTYHKVSNVLRCHYCGYAKVRDNKCSSCGRDSLNDFGLGTQKLEEYICENYDARVVRMDIDTTTSKGSHEKIIESFRRHEYDILIGTQMIAKGLDFPLVSLVGVLNSNASLNIPDFRSSERTFQLINQIAGRAGRGNIPGEVVVQGFNVDHYSIDLACKNDYVSFYEKEVSIRKKLKYPPYFNLCLIKASSRDDKLLNEEMLKIKKYLCDNLVLPVLGPNYSNISKVNNIYYMQIILKYKNVVDVYDSLYFLVDKYRKNRNINLDIDLCPLKI